ncbi:MAG TPA: hypothetical protein VFR87_20215 [Nocardioidaceae bacterium]|nr:hypothetical protein [Nocardioidaceae bacterium]
MVEDQKGRSDPTGRDAAGRRQPPGGVGLLVVAVGAALAVAAAASTLDLFLAMAALTLLAMVVFLSLLATARAFDDGPVGRLLGVVLGSVGAVLFLLSAGSPVGLVIPVVAAGLATVVGRTWWFVAATVAVGVAAAGATLMR